MAPGSGPNRETKHRVYREGQPFYVDAAANDFELPDFTKRQSHIFITHAHKDGKQYRGDGSCVHEVDIIIRVEKGIATTEKNRFGEVGQSLKVF